MNTEENDRCIECSAEVIDGGSWGYCIPCSNRVFAKLKENDMNNVTTLKWFYYDQNNSGEYFVINDDVAEEVYIQAPSAAEADARAEELFDGCSEYCECCGPRWSTGYMSDRDGTDVPTSYGTPITEVTASAYRNQARLHYFDGRVEAFEYRRGALTQ